MKRSIAIIYKILYRQRFLFVGGTCLLVIIMPGISVGQLSPSDTSFPYLIQGQDYDDTQPIETDFATGLIKPDTQDQEGLLKILSRFFRVTGTQYDDPETPATNYIKWILNMLLGLVSFLSLVMIIFAFYLIFFSKGEEAVTKAKKILIGVGIALAIMGLSRFIASFFFDIYGTVTGTSI